MRFGKMLFLTSSLGAVAAGIYLTSPQNRNRVRSIIENRNQLQQDLVHKAQDLKDNGKTAINELMDKASTEIESVGQVLNNTTQDIVDNTESKVGDFRKGINNARATLNKQYNV